MRLLQSFFLEILMTEEWKPISGYDGMYLVSNYGQVKSVVFRNGTTRRQQDRMMTPTDNGYGYKIVGLRNGTKKKNHYVHRLVAEAFIPNPYGYPVVDHIDHNRENNRVDNLQWCTQKENVHRSIELMSKPRTVATTNTGQKYISRTANGKYKLSLPWLRIWKEFKLLDDAIAARDIALCEEE